jgi:hypothetical protein
LTADPGVPRYLVLAKPQQRSSGTQGPYHVVIPVHGLIMAGPSPATSIFATPCS